VIARGLQKHGMIVGDNTGGSVVLKLEDTVTSGRGALRDLDRQSLCAIEPHHLEVLADPGSQAVPPVASSTSGPDTPSSLRSSDWWVDASSMDAKLPASVARVE